MDSRAANSASFVAQSYAHFLGSTDGNSIEYDVWENQRLSAKDNLFSHESRVTGDRPPWSTKDGKRAQHRDAFLLPDLTWRWDTAWYIATIDGKPLDPWEAQNGSGGWLYAPSYLVSTKQCSDKQNALSLVRRRRWMRRAVKIVMPSDGDGSSGGMGPDDFSSLIPAMVLMMPATTADIVVGNKSTTATTSSAGAAATAAVWGTTSDAGAHEESDEDKARAAFSQKLLETLPHPVFVAHYGFATSPDLVASSANSPHLNKEVVDAALPSTSLASRAFSALKSFSFFSSNNNNNINNNNNAPASPSSASNSTYVRSPLQSPPATPQRGSLGGVPMSGGSSSSPAVVRSVASGTTVSPASIAEVALLLKHHATFDTLQSFMADILVTSATAKKNNNNNNSNGGGPSSSPDRSASTAALSSSSASTSSPPPAGSVSVAVGGGGTSVVDISAAGGLSRIMATLPEHIQQILRDSGVPQALRHCYWLGFSGALHLKMKNPGRYKALLETVKKQGRIHKKNDPINLDIARTCSTHPYFCAGRGPGATTLRNILFAFEEMGLQRHAEEVARKREQQRAVERSKERVTDHIVDELFDVASYKTSAHAANKSSNDNDDEDAFAAANPPVSYQHSPVEVSQRQWEEAVVLDVTSLSSAASKNKNNSNNNNKGGGGHSGHGDDDEVPQIYHQALSYVASIFVMNLQNEEDAFWLLTVMAEQCPLMQTSEDGNRMMDNCVQSFSKELIRRVIEKEKKEVGGGGEGPLQQILKNCDLGLAAYGFFQALLCAHVSCPVASRLFDVFLINVRDISAFVDFAVTLVLKCLSDHAALSRFCASETGGAGRLDQVTLMKFLNEQMRRVSCDLAL